MRRTFAVLLLAVTLPTPAGAEDAQSEHSHCVGWAILGAAAGGQIVSMGIVGALGGFEPGGLAFSDPVLGRRNAWLLFLGPGLGVALGPIATCGLWGNEPHGVPAATFVMGGALVGAAVSLGAVLLFNDTNSRHPLSGEWGGLLSVLAVAGGGTLGALGGYQLHLARERAPSTTPTLAVLPLVGPGRTGLAMMMMF